MGGKERMMDGSTNKKITCEVCGDNYIKVFARSLETENYEIIQRLANCQNCGETFELPIIIKRKK